MSQETWVPPEKASWERECWYCSDEVCELCPNPSLEDPCEHDVIERHGDHGCIDPNNGEEYELEIPYF
ncbi:hypothetical protein HY346_00180 [Candidatus Microgenomates bacterium]|nr:hypothetical protein [Candidatus Microgenomates bacterium]